MYQALNVFDLFGGDLQLMSIPWHVKIPGSYKLDRSSEARQTAPCIGWLKNKPEVRLLHRGRSHQLFNGLGEEHLEHEMLQQNEVTTHM